MNWPGGLIFLFGIMMLLTLAVAYSIFKIQRIQRRQIRQLQYTSEKKYHELADLLPQVVFECDYDGRLTFLNAFGRELISLTRIDIQNGINISDLVDTNEIVAFKEDFLYTREGGLNKGQEYTVVPRSGRPIPMLFYMSAIIHNGKNIGLRGIIIDITEQKKLEQRLLSAIIETEDRERKRFSEDLHDGLGPLLSTIRLYINQIHLKSIKEEEKESLLRVTYDLLDEAILTTKSIANNILPGTISDHGLIPALRSFVNRIESTGIIRFEIDTNVEKRIASNIENTIYRIIIELINNTLKHGNATLINISIHLHSVLEVSYSDDGIGFDLTQKPKGLGLNNIRNRCKSIGADMKIFSEEGKGFKMFLTINDNNTYTNGK